MRNKSVGVFPFVAAAIVTAALRHGRPHASAVLVPGGNQEERLLRRLQRDGRHA